MVTGNNSKKQQPIRAIDDEEDDNYEQQDDYENSNIKDYELSDLLTKNSVNIDLFA